ncbi:OLC1v1014894C1 [Oldenlandia corymbosa var. corymbosa]|uniref:OLC1v1014894C1 n=1 Tax=Oldenlandia corymbosa var. corymbosa TaxID=529605 RepID=A0AAV1E240_OLDCO|nr:OLC1v1014894C1 [Oldenlandia corymbosa var. corymbosa]
MISVDGVEGMLAVYAGYVFEKMFQRAVPFNYFQRRTLVNVKLKWVKDRILDNAVAGGRHLRAGCLIISIIASNPDGCMPIYHISRNRGQLGLPDGIKVSSFMRRYPNVFEEFHLPDTSGSTHVPWFKLSSEALDVYQDEISAFQSCEVDILTRFKKLLMLCENRTLPLQTIDQLKWDLGLPYDYENSLIKRHSELFEMGKLDDGRDEVKLVKWDNRLAKSYLERNALSSGSNVENDAGVMAFPIGFTRGYGLKRKCLKWLEEWQKLPYTSPYVDASHLDPRTDESEKRVVGVFHELLHLMLQKKTERKNVSNMRKPLRLPQKFTKAFERHPGIFYISRKDDTDTVVLREAYNRDQLIEKHPLVDVRQKYFSMLKRGFLDRSRGLYEKEKIKGLEEDHSLANLLDCEGKNVGFQSGQESECSSLSD